LPRLLAPLLALALLPSGAAAQPSVLDPEIPAGTGGEEMLLAGVGVDETFDRSVPADATFLDHEGRAVRLGDVVDGSRPVLLHFVYYGCAIICENAINALAQTLAEQPWTVGMEYDVVTISMDPHDGPAEAASARGRVLGRYGRSEAERGWHFLTGTQAEIARVADAVGYHFRWDEPTQQFAHPAVVTLIAPSGRPARYLYGLELSSNDVRIGLLEAAEGATVMSPVEQALLFCFRWDRHESRYVLWAGNVMRAGGVLTVLLLGGFLFVYWRRERRASRSTTIAPATLGRGSEVHDG
jgi:protein SCO1